MQVDTGARVTQRLWTSVCVPLCVELDDNRVLVRTVSRAPTKKEKKKSADSELNSKERGMADRMARRSRAPGRLSIVTGLPESVPWR